MHIASFQIQNYKSFRDSGQVPLTPGFNVVVGQNNVGKTALVEALSLTAGDKAHRSLKSLPTPTAPMSGMSYVRAEFALSRPDIVELLGQVGDIYVPVYGGRLVEQALEEFRTLLWKEARSLRCTFRLNSVSSAILEAFGEHKDLTTCASIRLTDADGNVELVHTGIVAVGGVNQRFDFRLGDVLKNRVYAFRAERFNLGTHRFGHGTTLRPDAANLPEVLDSLQGRNPDRFARLNRFVQTVFPVVQRVTVRPQPSDQLEVIVWTVDPATEREDLAVPLTESGTGIGQVLAMLYVVLTADAPRVFLIDEATELLAPWRSAQTDRNPQGALPTSVPHHNTLPDRTDCGGAANFVSTANR